jgi:organic radical activating enzyme
MHPSLKNGFYCSKKFTYLTIDLEKNVTYNCHTADQQIIDLETISSARSELFNTSLMLTERNMMLNNERVPSCENSCWQYEDIGIESVRIRDKGYIQSHTKVRTSPEILEIIVNSECKMNCVYCCKEYSSSWRNDLVRNGPYANTSDGRYELTPKDMILSHLTKKQNVKRQMPIQDSIAYYLKNPNLKILKLIGGEPLLAKNLQDYTEKLNPLVKIEIYTGLGISISRLQSILEELNHSNTSIIISAETTGEFYNFIRHGATWNNFIEKVDIIKKSKLDIHMNMTFCNITLIDYPAFARKYSDIMLKHRFLSTPTFLAPYVIDDATKHSVIAELSNLNTAVSESIIEAIKPQPTELQRQQCGGFLTEYAARNSINLDFLPDSFREWLQI